MWHKHERTAARSPIPAAAQLALRRDAVFPISNFDAPSFRRARSHSAPFCPPGMILLGLAGFVFLPRILVDFGQAARARLVMPGSSCSFLPLSCRRLSARFSYAYIFRFPFLSIA